MEKNYTEPEIEIVKFEIEDIIASGIDPDAGTDIPDIEI